jgi:hypothetical protein
VNDCFAQEGWLDCARMDSFFISQNAFELEIKLDERLKELIAVLFNFIIHSFYFEVPAEEVQFCYRNSHKPFPSH